MSLLSASMKNILQFRIKDNYTSLDEILSFANKDGDDDKCLLRLVCQVWECDSESSTRKAGNNLSSCTFLAPKNVADFYLEFAPKNNKREKNSKGEDDKKYSLMDNNRFISPFGKYPMVKLVSKDEGEIEEFLRNYPHGISCDASDEEAKVSASTALEEGLKVIDTFHTEIGEAVWNSENLIPVQSFEWWVLTNLFSGLFLYNHNTVFQLWKLFHSPSTNQEETKEKEELKNDPWPWLLKQLLLLSSTEVENEIKETEETKEFLEWYKMISLLVQVSKISIPSGQKKQQHGHQEKLAGADKVEHPAGALEEEENLITNCFSQHTEFYSWEWYLSMQKLFSEGEFSGYYPSQAVQLFTLASQIFQTTLQI